MVIVFPSSFSKNAFLKRAGLFIILALALFAIILSTTSTAELFSAQNTFSILSNTTQSNETNSLSLTTLSVHNETNITLIDPTNNEVHSSNQFTIQLSNVSENLTCVVWGNWSSWSAKTTTNNTNLTNGTYVLAVLNATGLVHGKYYTWAVNCSSQSNTSDYRFSTNETFRYANETLLASMDGYEFDNTSSEAKTIPTNGSIQHHSFFPAGDVDWMKFAARAGERYLIRTMDLAPGVDTVLQLYSTDASTLINQSDDEVDGVLRWSKLLWTAPTDGIYYLKVFDFNTTSTGNYSLFVQAFPNFQLSFTTFPSTNTIQQGHFFNVSVNLTCLGGTCAGHYLYLDPRTQEPTTISKTKKPLSSTPRISPSLEGAFEQLAPGETLPVIVQLRTSPEEIDQEQEQLQDLRRQQRVGNLVPKQFSKNKNTFNKMFSTQTKGLRSLKKRTAILNKENPSLIQQELLRTRQNYVQKTQDAFFNKIHARQDHHSPTPTFSTLSTHDEAILVTHRLLTINAFTAELTKEGFEKLKNQPEVLSIEQEKTFSVENDQSIPLINADDVWQEQVNGMNITGAGQTVCIVDTGIAYNHTGFGGQNYFPNDKVIGGIDFVNHDNNPWDDNWHGTHVAGTIAAIQSNTYHGVAPDANIVAVKACDASGSCTGSNILAGIDWCISHANEFNISVISLSVGDDSSNATHYQTFCDNNSFSQAINYAADLGIVVPVAAGNNYWSDGVTLPSCASGAMAISSVRKDLSTIDFNRGNLTAILAPGWDITSLYPGNQYATSSGTSMATPHVSGAALLLNQYYQLNDGLRRHGEKIRDALTNANNLTRIHDSASGLDFPVLDVLKSFNEPIRKGIISTTNGAQPFYTTSTNPILINLSPGQSQEYTWQVNATGDFNTYEFFAFIPLDEVDHDQVSETKNLTIMVPTIPRVSLIAPANNTNATTGNQSFQFTINDTTSTNFTCSLKINGSINQTNNFTLGNNSFAMDLSEGTYSWSIACTDESSNSNESETRTTRIVDTQPPIITIDQPSNNTYSPTTTGDIIFSANDASNAVANCSVFIDNATNPVYTNTSVIEGQNITTTQTLTEGVHQWNITCYDTANNLNDATTPTRTLTIDTTLPNTSINLSGTFNATSGWYVSPVTFTLVTNETNPDKTFYNYTGTEHEYLAPTTILQQGNITLYYYSKDLAGNTEQKKNVTFAIDSEQPLLENFTIDPYAPKQNYSLTLNLSIRDITSGLQNATIEINGGTQTIPQETFNNVTPTIYQKTFTPTNEANYTITIRATDNAGNSITQNYVLHVGKGATGEYNFSTNYTTIITNTTNHVEVIIQANDNFTDNFTISEYQTQPDFVDEAVTNAFRYVDFDPSTRVQNNLSWTLIKIYYTTTELRGYNKSTLRMYWYNESNNHWQHLTPSLDFVNATSTDETNNYVWANLTHFSTYAINADKILCTDVYSDEEITDYCFDETDTLRSSGYMCDDEYSSSSCPVPATQSTDEGDSGAGGSGGGGGFAFPTPATNENDSESDEPVEIHTTNIDEPVSAVEQTTNNQAGNGEDNVTEKNSRSEIPFYHFKKYNLGERVGFIVLLAMLIGFFVYAGHFRDRTHRLSVNHKVNRYLDVHKGEVHEDTMTAWLQDPPRFEDEQTSGKYDAVDNLSSDSSSISEANDVKTNRANGDVSNDKTTIQTNQTNTPLFNFSSNLMSTKKK